MYRDITLNNTQYRADLGVLLDHRITVKAGEVFVSADLDGRTPDADFEATFTGRGAVNIIVTPEPTENGESYAIGDATMEPGDDLKLAKHTKLAEIAAARWAAEVGGVVVNNMTIDTSRESQGMITGAALQATLDEAYTCQWKTATGFVVLTAEQIIAVAQAVREHVQTCFDREAGLTYEVNAAETIAAVEAISW
jgi:hypothetical protein